MRIAKHTPSPPMSEVRLIWLDLEMSGLEPDTDKILEAAFVITDGDLNSIAESVWVLHHPDSIFDGMDEWNRRTHNHSGLIERCRNSALTAEAAEEEILTFLRTHAREGGSPMCGNSICQDRRFLAHHMPKLEAFFHYRNFDVTSLKIAAYLYAPKIFEEWDKPPSRHRGLDDVHDSIKEFRHYHDHLFRSE